MGHKHSKTQKQTFRRHSLSHSDLSQSDVVHTPSRRSAQPTIENVKVVDYFADFRTSLTQSKTLVKDKGEDHFGTTSLPKKSPAKTFQRFNLKDRLDTTPNISCRQTPSILYYIDMKRYHMCIFDPNTGVWKRNDLKLAQCEHSNFELSSYATVVLRNQILPYLQESKLVAVDNDTLHIIGKIHLEYSVSKNSFKYLGDNTPKVGNPTICYGAKNIFVLSGEHDNGYVSDCASYYIEKQVWISMPAMPSPHVNGSAVYYHNTDGSSSDKIVVLGGFTSKIPTLFNYTASVFDIETNSWDIIHLGAIGDKLPKFIAAPIVQNVQGTLLILHEDQEELNFFELDLSTRTLQKAEGLFPDIDLSGQRKISCCFDEENNELIFLTRTCQNVNSLTMVGERFSERPLKDKLPSEYSVTRVSLNQNQSLIIL